PGIMQCTDNNTGNINMAWNWAVNGFWPTPIQGEKIITFTPQLLGSWVTSDVNVQGYVAWKHFTPVTNVQPNTVAAVTYGFVIESTKLAGQPWPKYTWRGYYAGVELWAVQLQFGP